MSKYIDIILEEIKKSEYDYYGLRQLPNDQEIEIGHELIESNHWVDGNYTDDKCGGACAMEIINDQQEADEVEECDVLKAIHFLGKSACKIFGVESKVNTYWSYEGSRVVLCGSNYAEWGQDEGEIIMSEAVCLHIANEQ